jgi:hypothetical protein
VDPDLSAETIPTATRSIHTGELVGHGRKHGRPARGYRPAGGFYEGAGPGSPSRSGDDWNLVYDSLRMGFTAIQDPSIPVVHWGARPYATGEARALIANYHFGVGAGYTRRARRGDLFAALFLVYEVVVVIAQVVPMCWATGVPSVSSGSSTCSRAVSPPSPITVSGSTC